MLPGMTGEHATYIYRDFRIQPAAGAPAGCVDLTSHLAVLVADAGLDAGLLNVQTADSAAALLVEGEAPGPAVNLTVRDGRLQLASSQRVIFLDLGAVRRDVRVLLMGEGK
jgi:thiamine phosphate synthase YjbQ (UPF0047 family)